MPPEHRRRSSSGAIVAKSLRAKARRTALERAVVPLLPDSPALR